MSQESQKIAALRDRLALIESTQVNENPFKTGYQAMKNLFKGSKPAAPKPAATTPPSTTPSGTVNTARPNNPNAPYKEVPGARPVTKDLTGAPVNPGGISATGSVGAARAQTAADAQLAAGRAASKDALGAMRPNPVGGAIPKPVGGAGSTAANALKNNPGKTAAGAAVVGAAAGGVAALSGDDAADPTTSGAAAPAAGGGTAGGAAGGGTLSPEDRKELDALAAELEVHMGRLPELDNLLLQHQALAQGGAATKPAADPELDTIKKNAGIPASANDGNAGEAEAQAAMAAKQPAAAPTQTATAAPAQASAPPSGGPVSSTKTTNTSSQTNVSGTIKMGKPEGPIQYNGKTVNPGQPEYAAASQALMKSKSDLNARSQRARQQGAAPASTEPAAPVQQGAANASKSNW